MGDDVGKCEAGENYAGLWEVPLYQAQIGEEMYGVGSECPACPPAFLPHCCLPACLLAQVLTVHCCCPQLLAGDCTLLPAQLLPSSAAAAAQLPTPAATSPCDQQAWVSTRGLELGSCIHQTGWL